MNKEQLLGVLAQSIKIGTVTKEEVMNVCDLHPAPVNQNNPESDMFAGKKPFSATNILYLIGGLILLIGIGTLTFKFWADLSSLVRVTLTLGISVVAFISGILLRSDNQTSGIAVVMQVIGAVLAPIGIFIALNEYGVANIGIGWMTTVSVFLAIVYILSLALFRSLVFFFFSIAYSTWALYSVITYVLTESSVIITDDVYKYLTLAVAASYLLLSSYVKKTSHYALRGALDFFGSVGIYGAILALSGYKPDQSILWELIGVAALFGGLYMASVGQNRTILKTTAIFIFIYIGKFTAEYFADSFGWPISLILGGLALIGVGFGLVKFSKKV